MYNYEYFLRSSPKDFENADENIGRFWWEMKNWGYQKYVCIMQVCTVTICSFYTTVHTTTSKKHGNAFS